MSRRYSALIRSLAREADEAARAKAKQRAASALQDARNHGEIWSKSVDWRVRKEAFKKFLELFPGSAEYLNRQLDERLRDLANVLSDSLCNNSIIDLSSLKKPELAGADAADEILEHNQQIDNFARAIEDGEPSAISDYFELVLRCTIYPDGFHKNAQIVYANELRQLVVDYQLPTVDKITPTVEIYKKKGGRRNR